MRHCVVVGAGLAGLAAAVRLADAGMAVTVLERSAAPGGRVRRLRPAGSGRTPIDCGQHLMLGCYHRSIEFARRLGTSDLLHRVEGVTPFVTGPGKVHPYRLGRLPAPLHAVPGLLGLTHIPAIERLGLVRAAVAAKVAVRLDPSGLDRQDALDWLRRNGQGPAAIEGFWGPLASATLNRTPPEASALLLATVIDKGFFASRDDAVPVLPRTTLHDLFIGPAVREVKAKGGRVLTGAKVERLEADPGGRVKAARTSRGQVFAADTFVVAVPSWDLRETVGGVAGLDDLADRAEALSSSPIVSIEMWFDRPWMRYPFAGLIGSPVQWVFDHPAAPGGPPPRVSAVMSHAGESLDAAGDSLVTLCESELRRMFPEASGARLVSGVAVKARRATFAASPGQQALRPPARTALPNLFLAGDWTATGLPATIEGAVASGLAAADLALAEAQG